METPRGILVLLVFMGIVFIIDGSNLLHAEDEVGGWLRIVAGGLLIVGSIFSYALDEWF